MQFHDKYAQRNKRLLRLERELARLSQAQGNAPVVPLEHPYQRGWFKTYTLREDALHHPVQWRCGPEAAVVLRATAACADQCD